MKPDPLAIEGRTWCIFGHHYPAFRGGGAPDWASTLMEKDGWFATGLTRFTLTFVQQGPYVPAHLASGIVVRDGSDGQRARWEAFMAQLPTRKFARKRRELTLTLRGDPALDFVDRHYLVNVAAADIKVATAMIIQALEQAQGTFKAADGVDLGPMIRSAKDLLARSWPDDEAFRADLKVAFDLDRARIAAMDPWSKIDMRGFHRSARKILDLPSDWSAGDDFSPHGNDLGADILADWSRLKGQSVSALAKHFEIDRLAEDAEASMGRIQIAQALAFGHIKKSGACPKDLAILALQILRTDTERAGELVVPEHFAAWQAACARYRSILEWIVGKD